MSEQPTVNIISALHRLERAGSEHSDSTAKLIRAAGALAAHIAPLVPEARFVEENDLPEPQLPGGYYRLGDEICFYDEQRSGSVPVNDDRISALQFARAIANGWLDELAAWLAKRSEKNAGAATTLERAAEALREVQS